MTRTSLLAQAVHVAPSPDERLAAARVADAIAQPAHLALVLADGTQVPLSEAMVAVLRTSADELADGHAITVLPSEAELTPAEAAKLLGLSRPFVTRLLDDGEIASHRLPKSRHRRVLLSDIVAFQNRRERRRAGRDAIGEIVETAELPY